MSFILAIVQRPPEDAPRAMRDAWIAFPEFAKVESLKSSDGVYRIGQNAWIFNSRKAIPEYGSVITQAHNYGLQLHIFHLDDKSLQSHIDSSPRSEDLEKFLSA